VADSKTHADGFFVGGVSRPREKKARPHSADLRLHRYDASNRVYFVTKRIKRNSGINLTDEKIANALIETLFWLVENRKIWLLGFVVMPDHVHLALAPRAPFLLRQVTHSLFGYFVRKVNAEMHRAGPVWEEEYHEHLVTGRGEVHTFLDYIHLNPVRKGLAADAKEWPFSSLVPKHRSEESWKWYVGT
jgi:putative transposase